MEDRPPIPQSRKTAEQNRRTSTRDSTPPKKLPKALCHGWRQSMCTSAWYRRRNGWTAIVVAVGNGYRIVLRRAVWTFEDALADANAVLR